MRKLRWWIAGLGFFVLLAFVVALRNPKDALDRLIPFTIAEDTRYEDLSLVRIVPSIPGTPIVAPPAIEQRVFYVRKIGDQDLLNILRSRAPQLKCVEATSNKYFFMTVPTDILFNHLNVHKGPLKVSTFPPPPPGTRYTIVETRAMSAWEVKMLRLRNIGTNPFFISNIRRYFND